MGAPGDTALPTACAYCPAPVAYRCVECGRPLCRPHAIECGGCGRHGCPDHARADLGGVPPDEDHSRPLPRLSRG